LEKILDIKYPRTFAKEGLLRKRLRGGNEGSCGLIFIYSRGKLSKPSKEILLKM